VQIIRTVDNSETVLIKGYTNPSLVGMMTSRYPSPSMSISLLPGELSPVIASSQYTEPSSFRHTTLPLVSTAINSSVWSLLMSATVIWRSNASIRAQHIDSNHGQPSSHNNFIDLLRQLSIVKTLKSKLQYWCRNIMTITSISSKTITKCNKM